MNKYLLVSIIFLGAIIAFILFTSLHTAQRETASAIKTKYLCDSAVADCSKNTPKIPNGVCIPGGKCT
jgi:hypothetical protein